MKTTTIRLTQFCLIVIVLCLESFGLAITRNENISNNDIIKIFNQNLPYNQIIYSITPRGVIISFPSSIFFETGQDNLLDNSKPLLDKIGKIIKELNLECSIEANIENNQYNKNLYNSNLEYSTILADKITKYLINQSKYNPTKLKSIGFGEIMPFQTLNSNQQKNNRIDFVLFNYDE